LAQVQACLSQQSVTNHDRGRIASQQGRYRSIVDYQFKEFLDDFDDRSAWDGKVVISFNRFTRRMGAMALLFTTVVTVVCNS